MMNAKEAEIKLDRQIERAVEILKMMDAVRLIEKHPLKVNFYVWEDSGIPGDMNDE